MIFTRQLHRTARGLAAKGTKAGDPWSRERWLQAPSKEPCCARQNMTSRRLQNKSSSTICTPKVVLMCCTGAAPHDHHKRRLTGVARKVS